MPVSRNRKQTLGRPKMSAIRLFRCVTTIQAITHRKQFRIPDHNTIFVLVTPSWRTRRRGSPTQTGWVWPSTSPGSSTWPDASSTFWKPDSGYSASTDSLEPTAAIRPSLRQHQEWSLWSVQLRLVMGIRTSGYVHWLMNKLNGEILGFGLSFSFTLISHWLRWKRVPPSASTRRRSSQN